jgi:hypothetical protein
MAQTGIAPGPCGGGNPLPFARFTAPPANEQPTLSSDREN